MQASEMNIHKLSNIIYLPKHEESHAVQTIHRGSHPEYTSKIERKLDVTHEYGKANDWNKSDYQKAISQIRTNERKVRHSGKTTLNKNSIRKVSCG